MRSIFSVACILGCALSLNAQIATSMNRLSNGSTEIKIRNNSAVSLTAFTLAANVFSVNQGVRTAADRPPVAAGFDTAIAPATEPLPANQERILLFAWPGVGTCSLVITDVAGALRLEEEHAKGRMVANPNAPTKGDACQFGEPITAGIFADGTTTGDAGLLTKLMLRRSNMLLAVETTLDMLSAAGRRNIPQDQLIAQFKKVTDSLRHWYLLPEQQIGLNLYQSMVGKLMSLPKPKIGEPFPPGEFVEREVAVLRRQRVTLLESQPSLAYVSRIPEKSK